MVEEAVEKSVEKRIDKVKHWFKDRENLILFSILAIAFGIRLYFFFVTKNQPLWWDEAEYMLKAKSIAFGTSTTGWFSYRPVLFSLISALFFKIGLGEKFIRFLFVIMSTVGVYLVYNIGKNMFTKKVGLIAAFVATFLYLDLFYTSRLLVDMPQVFFVLLGMALFVKYFFNGGSKKLVWWILPLLVIGALIRFTVGIEVIVLLIFLLAVKGISLLKDKEWYISLGIGVLLFIPYMIYSWISYHNPLHIFTIFSQGEATRSAMDTPLRVFMQYIQYSPSYVHMILYCIFLIGLVFMLFSLFIRYGKIRESKDANKYLLLLLWIIVPLIYFGFFVNHFEDRYIFMVFPAVFIIIGWIIDYFSEYAKKYKNIFTIVVILLLAFSASQMFIHSNDLIHGKVSSYDSLGYSGLWIKQNSNIGDSVYSSGVPQNTYYSERATYPYPDNESDFLKQINEKKPRYMILSVWEKSPDWAYTWPDKNADKVKIAQAYFFDAEKKQASVAIYEFIY